jgi:transcriptional regulator with XRE-family HTH domain
MSDQLLDLKTWRRRRLLTVRALALAAGVTASTVVRLESGQQTPQPRTIKAVSAALGVEPEHVLEFRHAMGLPESGAESNDR